MERINDLYGLSEQQADVRLTEARDNLHQFVTGVACARKTTHGDRQEVMRAADTYAQAAVAKAVAHLIEIGSLAPAFTHSLLFGVGHECNGCRR